MAEQALGFLPQEVTKNPPSALEPTTTVISQSGHFRRGVRKSMVRLPTVLQPLLTYLTGKPIAGQGPTLRLHPAGQAVVALASTVGLFAAQAYLLIANAPVGLLTLVPFWVLATGCIRRFQVVYAHHASHNALARSRLVNRFLADAMTTIALIQNGDDYKKTHVSHHKRRDFSTDRDIGARFLLANGFAPGMSKAALWRRFWVSVFSPVFHCRFLLVRLRSNFIDAPIYRRVLSVLWVAVLALIAAEVPAWIFVAVFVVPMVPFYQISTLLNTITEHAWMAGPDGPADMEQYAERCWARFCGEACPDASASGVASAWSWVRWSARMLAIHIPARLAVLVGDTPAHDWHHLGGYEQRPTEWPYAIYHREAAITAGKGYGLAEREIWGLWAAIDHSFGQLASAPTRKSSG